MLLLLSALFQFAIYSMRNETAYIHIHLPTLINNIKVRLGGGRVGSRGESLKTFQRRRRVRTHSIYIYIYYARAREKTPYVSPPPPCFRPPWRLCGSAFFFTHSLSFRSTHAPPPPTAGVVLVCRGDGGGVLMRSRFTTRGDPLKVMCGGGRYCRLE